MLIELVATTWHLTPLKKNYTPKFQIPSIFVII